MDNMVSIIIVTRNSEKYIKSNIESIIEATKEINAEIVVIDNDSSDRTLDVIRENFPEVKIFKCDKNNGFGYANNIGWRYSKGNYLLFLNPDTIIDKDSLKNAIERMKKNREIGLLGAKVYNSNGKLQIPCTTTLRGLWAEFCVQFYLYRLFPNNNVFASYTRTYDKHDSFQYVDAVAGCFMFFRREAFEDINGFDENIFLYCEEEDIGYRLKKKGWKVCFDPKVKLTHYGGHIMGTRSSDLWLIISQDYVARKQHSYYKYILIRLLRIVGYLLRIIFLLFSKSFWLEKSNRKKLNYYFYGLKINLLGHINYENKIK